MKHRRYLALGVVLIGAAAIGLASWGYARPATASPGSSNDEEHYLNARTAEQARPVDGLWRMEEGPDSFDLEGQDEESDTKSQDEESDTGSQGEESGEGGDLTTPATGLTTTTTAGPTTTTTSELTTTTTAGATTTTAPSVDAAALYAQYCSSSSCHPNGAPSGLTTAQVANAITNGVPGMPAFSGSMTGAQITALATYVFAGGH